MKVILNPDREHVEIMRAALKRNGGYCPCMTEKTKDTECRCKEFRDQIEKGIEGMCHCGLWLAVKDD